jgi:hypothetical protein
MGEGVTDLFEEGTGDLAHGLVFQEREVDCAQLGKEVGVGGEASFGDVTEDGEEDHVGVGTGGKEASVLVLGETEEGGERELGTCVEGTSGESVVEEGWCGFDRGEGGEAVGEGVDCTYLAVGVIEGVEEVEEGGMREVAELVGEAVDSDGGCVVGGSRAEVGERPMVDEGIEGERGEEVDVGGLGVGEKRASRDPEGGRVVRDLGEDFVERFEKGVERLVERVVQGEWMGCGHGWMFRGVREVRSSGMVARMGVWREMRVRRVVSRIRKVASWWRKRVQGKG